MSKFKQPNFMFDAYEIEDDSDDDRVVSSDEEIDKLASGSKTRRQNVYRRRNKKESSSEDEFEKEMAAELNETFKNFQGNSSQELSAASSHAPVPSILKKEEHSNKKTALSKVTSTRPRNRNSHDLYLGSNSEDEDMDSFQKDSQPGPSNDDLLYDPDMDDNDQKWVDGRRRNYLGRQYGKKMNSDSSTQQQRAKRLPNSDAVLNCQACMSLLTLDCQRHATHQHQYRAMFVSNCIVDTSERLRFPVTESTKPSRRNKNKKRKHNLVSEKNNGEMEGIAEEQLPNNGGLAAGQFISGCEGDGGQLDEVYNPVRCSVCNTQVAVYDTDEVYHFFNVLSSHT